MTADRTTIGTWLINLPRDIERRIAMERQLSALGLPFQLFAAVDGKVRHTELLAQAD